MSSVILNLEEAPVWNFLVKIRGMDLPMTSPIDCVDMPASPVPTQGEIDQMTKRWPGLFIWLWRFIAGGPRVRRDDLPQDGGAEHARVVCRVILGDGHAQLVSELSTGECVQIVDAYMGCQQQWVEATRRWASMIAGKSTDRSVPAPATTSSGQPMTRVIPGGKIPAALQPQRHPLVSDDTAEADGGEG